jgi:hypothetical protein
LNHSRSGNSGKKKTAAEGLSVSGTASRRPRNETEAAPLRLCYRDCGPNKGTTALEADLSEIVVEVPLSTMSRFLSKRLALELYQFIRNCTACLERPLFPCPLAELRQNRGLLAALRARLPLIGNLIELITDPPAILMDERQQLCFFRGFPVALSPFSFRYLFLLARSPGKFVTRTAIYNHLWQGEMGDEARPYERQISDHKYHLAAEIKKGVVDRLALGPGEVEGMFTTQYKQGYRLNLAQDDVLVFTKKDLLVLAFVLLLRRWLDALPSWLPFWRCLGSMDLWNN